MAHALLNNVISVAPRKQLSNNIIIMRRNTSACLAAAIITLACAGSVNANTITAVIGGQAQSGANYVNFDVLSGGQTATYTSGGLTVSFDGNARTAPAVSPAPQLPYLSGNNNVNFGSAYTGPDTTTFLSAGNIAGAGKLTFNFTTAQNYLGLLWGSIDFGVGNGLDNMLTFYSGANGTGSVVDFVDGNSLVALNTSLDDNLTFNGSGDITGTAYVNINTTAAFESVVATSGNFTFEIDNVAYQNTGSVPDGGTTVGLLGMGLAGLASLRKWLARADAVAQPPIDV